MNIDALYRHYLDHPVVTTDSRDCPAGSIFIALKGDNFDGNRFAARALDDGCSLAVVDDVGVREAYLAAGGDAARMMLVPDALQALKLLAREHRRQFQIPVLGITGTNGKTTTKELVREVLACRYSVMATEGNFNNDVGVPKTLFRLTPEHEIAIIEMGASHPGDIRTLAETAEPTCGLITNVGKAHLQGFGSLDGVLHTKGELYDYLAANGGERIFVNADDRRLMSVAPAAVPTTRYATTGAVDADVTGSVVACDPFVRFTWSRRGGAAHTVATHLVGAYNVHNALAAIAVGLHFGVDEQLMCRAIEAYRPGNARSQLVDTGRNVLIVDAYNANPTSMAAALDNFERLDGATHKMVIIGEMRELGDSSADEHRRVLDRLDACHFDTVWLVGQAFADLGPHYRTFHDVAQVKAALQQELPQHRHILIKGSNGTRLFQLPEML